MFTRRRSSNPAEQQRAVDAFWAWWRQGGAEETEQAIADANSERLAEHLGARLQAIHSGFAWELTQGTISKHLLVVSSEGNPDVRAVAARWLRAAPPTDGTWDYADSRQPASDMDSVVLSINGQEVGARSATVGARVNGSQVNVGVFHPAFAAMSEQERRVAALLLLDAALGEQAVESWLGEISVETVPLPDAIPLHFLRSIVGEVAETALDPDGEPAWILGHGTDPKGHEVLATAQSPLKSALWPHLDTHVSVLVPYRDRTENGWPQGHSLDALRQFETHLNDRIKGSGRLVAHVSVNGERTLHLYVDGATPAAEQLKAAVGGWEQGRVTVEVNRDPGWTRVANLRM